MVELVKTKFGNVVTLSLGRKCNNACVMCITPLGNSGEPSFEGLKAKIDNLENPIEIYFSGGEPTIRGDFFKIVNYVRKLYPNSKLGVVTNGRMFAYPGFASKVFKSRVTKIITEIHAHNQGLHDSITSVSGSFDQTVRGIDNILELPFELEIRIVIHRINYTYLPEIAEFLVKKYPPKVRFVMFPISIIGRAFKEKDKVVVANQMIKPYVEKAAEIFLKHNRKVFIFHLPHCMIDRKYWQILPGVTTIDRKIYFPERCDGCMMRPNCSGLWKTYAFIVGDKEINPIK